MFPVIFYDLMILATGYVIPAYNSYKAVKNKDTREYTRLMMYWVVFAAFVTLTTITDIFVFWLPLYYEAKLSAVVWMSSSYTQGSTLLYRRLVHPELVRREPQIESTLERVQAEGWRLLLQVWALGRSLVLEGITAMLHSQQQYGIMRVPPQLPVREDNQEPPPPEGGGDLPEYSEDEDLEDEFVHIGHYYPTDSELAEAMMDLTDAPPLAEPANSQGTRRSARLAAKHSN